MHVPDTPRYRVFMISCYSMGRLQEALDVAQTLETLAIRVGHQPGQWNVRAVTDVGRLHDRRRFSPIGSAREERPRGSRSDQPGMAGHESYDDWPRALLRWQLVGGTLRARRSSTDPMSSPMRIVCIHRPRFLSGCTPARAMRSTGCTQHPSACSQCPTRTQWAYGSSWCTSWRGSLSSVMAKTPRASTRWS